VVEEGEEEDKEENWVSEETRAPFL